MHRITHSAEAMRRLLAVHDALLEQGVADLPARGLTVGALARLLTHTGDEPLLGGQLLAPHALLTPVFGATRLVDPASSHAAVAVAGVSWSQAPVSWLGALYQALLARQSEGRRRELGAHYTSERDIHRVLGPLLLDRLTAELRAARGNTARLRTLMATLARVRVLDPACGCGDFLLVGYAALRRLEAEAAIALGERWTPRVGRHQLFGIELDPHAAAVAITALDVLDRRLGRTGSAPHVVVGNALRLDWHGVLPHPDAATFIAGNPPFLGKKEQTPAQRSDSRHVWAGTRGTGVLDYSAGWLRAASQYLRGSAATAAFVTTSSLAQGEQVGALWRALRSDGPAHLRFAHTPFPWASEVGGAATVHVVVLGIGAQPATAPLLVDHATDPPTRAVVRSLSPYLVDADDTLVLPRSRPLQASTQPVHYGSFALDDGHFTLSAEARDSLLAECPEAKPWVRPFVGGEELLRGTERACLWLDGADPAAFRSLAPVQRRVEAVRAWRLSRTRARTLALAATPHLFAERRQPSERYLAVPTVSSEHRLAQPAAFVDPGVIASNQIYVLEEAGAWELGVLASAMHLAWIHRVAGRLGAGLRYSSRIVYNNFPWPEPSTTQRRAVEQAAAEVLAARARHPLASLAELYSPDTAPDDLRAAHRALDLTVDRCYRAAPFPTDRSRVEHLLRLHAALA
ncbi:MAG: hypothetical protein ACI8PZ_005043 [Myxococcota bacterium]|jgi:hypothetical protein